MQRSKPQAHECGMIAVLTSSLNFRGGASCRTRTWDLETGSPELTIQSSHLRWVVVLSSISARHMPGVSEDVSVRSTLPSRHTASSLTWPWTFRGS